MIGVGGDRTPLTARILWDCALNELVPGVRPGILLGDFSVLFGRMILGEADCTLLGQSAPDMISSSHCLLSLDQLGLD